MKLSILIPCYNERDTIAEIVERVRLVDLRVHVRDGHTAAHWWEAEHAGRQPEVATRPGSSVGGLAPEPAPAADGTIAITVEKEIVVVDDGSRDGTRDILPELAGLPGVHVFYHAQNMGKGAAVRTAIENATGDIMVVQDADLEYDPRDLPALLQPILEQRASVVYGSRFLGGPRKTMFFSHMLGNKLLTFCANLLFDTILSDMETGYKMVTREVAQQLRLTSRGWGFDPEITARILRRGYRIYEVPISYTGREFAEGKKISWRDGLTVLWTLLKYRFVG